MACGLNTCLELSSNVNGTRGYRRHPLKVRSAYTLLYVNTKNTFTTQTHLSTYTSHNYVPVTFHFCTPYVYHIFVNTTLRVVPT